MLDSSIKIWRNQKQSKKYLGKQAKVVSWTKVYVAATDFKADTPYISAIVELMDSGERIFAQITDSTSVKIGDKVIGVLRRLHSIDHEKVIPYGVKFVLA